MEQQHGSETAQSNETPSGDLSTDEFRRYGHQIVEWLAGYLDHPESYPVLSRASPGDVSYSLPVEAPDEPESMDDILRDFQSVIVPGITHWNHPAFFAYFAVTGSIPGILAEFLAAGLNVNAMLWRTSPAATELETRVLEWLGQLIGLSREYEGVIYDTASISSLVAIAAAREATGLDIRRSGMAGREDMPRLRLYCSEEAHSSIEKAAITLGVGQEGVRKIPVDDEFRMDVGALERAIEQDIRASWRPFCVVATAGTTVTTSIDDIRAIGAIAARHNLWLHVDAAYGGVAAMVPETAELFDGIQQADSIVVNPHKWLFTPVDLSAFYCRRLDEVRAAFSLIPAYLETPEGPLVRDYMNYGPQLGRRFRALKLWFVLRAYGKDGIIDRLREHLRLAKLFEQWVRDDPDWEVLAPVPLSVVCFRAHPVGMADQALDVLNIAIENTVNATGEAFLAHTVLRGKVTLRLAIGNLRTEVRHVARTWELLRGALASESQDA